MSGSISGASAEFNTGYDAGYNDGYAQGVEQEDQLAIIQKNHVEAKQSALLAAGMSWGGITAVRNRDDSILTTAQTFLEWLES